MLNEDKQGAGRGQWVRIALVGKFIPLAGVSGQVGYSVEEELDRLHHRGGKHRVHAPRRAATKPARQIDHPPAMHAGVQRWVKLGRKGKGPPHALQAAAHVEAVGATDGCVGLRREMPVSGIHTRSRSRSRAPLMRSGQPCTRILEAWAPSTLSLVPDRCIWMCASSSVSVGRSPLDGPRSRESLLAAAKV
mmetsp:Transcript_66944/g.97933  ORF Transcript_66944/g.97933 Transcript_66944/m.97933 type:complete len:191 (+) Transcript_66944:71-643(+)